MKRTHALAFALAIGVIVTLTLGTGSFSTTDAARDVTIETNDDAYLDVESADSPSVDAGNSSTVDLLTLTNEFETELESISVTTGHDNVSALSYDETLATGASTTLSAEVTCGPDPLTVDLDVTAEGEDVSVETTEEITVACE